MRLIDADELFKWYTGQRTKYPVGKGAEQYSTLMMYEILDEIDNAPTIDPVKHGRWIRPFEYSISSYDESGYRVAYKTTSTSTYCSKCGQIKLDNEVLWLYCPNCGCKMDGDENE